MLEGYAAVHCVVGQAPLTPALRATAAYVLGFALRQGRSWARERAIAGMCRFGVEREARAFLARFDGGGDGEATGGR